MRFFRLLITVAITVLGITLGSRNALSQAPESPVGEEGRTIVVELYDNYFDPKEIRIAKGEKTKIWLKNKGVNDHTFTVVELDVDVELKPGVEKMVTVEPQTAGTFKVICRFHEKEGMVGELHVQ